MGFDLARAIGWMRERKVALRVRRADGTPIGDSACAGVRLESVEFDSRLGGPGVLFCAVPGETTHGVRFLGAALRAGCPAALVEGRAPQIAGSAAVVLEVEDPRAALNAAARGWLDLHAPRVVGITGSNGKTTTKDLLAIALRGSCAAAATPGNRNSGWGLPAAVLGFSGAEDVLVLEMGASAPDEIGRLAAVARPWMGCITNIGAAHVEFFGDEDGVARTKGQLVEALPVDGVAVLNRDDARFDALAARTRARIVSFGHDPRADLRIEQVQVTRDGIEFVVAGHRARLPLFGAHNAWNAAAAAAMARELGVSLPLALERMGTVVVAPHRSRQVEVGGRVVVDDCYNANPNSMGKAIDGIAALPTSGRRILVLGDMAELGAHAEAGHRSVIASALAHEAIDLVLVAGPQMHVAALGLRDPRLVSGPRVEPARLAQALALYSEPGDVILLKASRSAALERVLDALGHELREGLLGPGGPF